MHTTNTVHRQHPTTCACLSPAHRDVFPLLFLALLFSAFLLILAGTTAAQDEVIPDDPYFNWQASYHNDGGDIELKQYTNWKKTMQLTVDSAIHHNLPRAWSITTGSKDVIVAILDDGFFYNHEDVSGNIWENLSANMPRSP